MGRTERKGSFREELIYLDRDILRGEPGKQICVSSLVGNGQEGKREERQGEWINESMKERQDRLSHFIKLIQRRLNLNEDNGKPKKTGREPG